MTDHFEALFDQNYLRWFHLNEYPSLVEITNVERNVELTMRGGVKKKSPVVYLKQVQGKIDDIKPLVLNKTNAQSIAMIHGDKPSLWKGKQVVLFVSETELYDSDLRKMVKVNCVRVRNKKEQADD